MVGVCTISAVMEEEMEESNTAISWREGLYEALKDNDTNGLFSASIVWDGGAKGVHARWFPTLRQARLQAIKMAKRDGYTIPRWWQFWRREDTDVRKWRKK